MRQSLLISPVFPMPYALNRVHTWHIVRLLFAEHIVQSSANKHPCPASIFRQPLVVRARKHVEGLTEIRDAL